ncbi:MAG: glycoside hydrolase family 172 protein [Marinoscillum sp.]
MRTKKVFFGLFVTLLSYAAFAQQAEVSIASLLKEMVDREAIARFPQANFKLKQESSYNRASQNPEDTVGWFINHDYNSSEEDHNFIRIEQNDGQQEWVFMDQKGPGAIVRTWMPFMKANQPDTDIQIKIYLDGSDEPVLKGNMLGLLDGTGEIPYPLAHQSLRSAVSFYPIPYAQSCKITTTAQPFFYQFTYRAYDEGTAVKTFSTADFDKTMPLTKEIGKRLLNPEYREEGQEVDMVNTLNSGKEKGIKLPKGNAAIRSLSVKLSNYSNPEVTRTVVLKMEFDGKETVWCPIGDFFGSGIGLNPVQGWYNTVEEDGTMTTRWVMPYQKSAKLSVLNLGAEPVEVVLKARVDDWQWDDASMYFNAAWRGQYPVPTRPFSDWNYVTLKGRGVYVGDALTVMNPVKKWWGEGDEKIWVDGEDFPSIFGTGTEDYYGYSWGGRSTDFYEHPFHAQPRCHIYNKLNRKVGQEKNTQGYSTETRSRALDTMPFSSSLQLDMEIWSWTDCEMGYGVGMYWYGDRQTDSNRSPDENEVLNIPPLPEGFTGRSGEGE